MKLRRYYDNGFYYSLHSGNHIYSDDTGWMTTVALPVVVDPTLVVSDIGCSLNLHLRVLTYAVSLDVGWLSAGS